MIVTSSIGSCDPVSARKSGYPSSIKPKHGILSLYFISRAPADVALPISHHDNFEAQHGSQTSLDRHRADTAIQDELWEAHLYHNNGPILTVAAKILQGV